MQTSQVDSWRSGSIQRAHCRSDAAIPLDGRSQTVAKAGGRPPAKLTHRARRVKLAARLTIRPGRVEADFAAETCSFGDQVRQVGDVDFLATTQIDGLGAFVALQRRDYSLGTIGRKEKLAGRCARAPQDNRLVTMLGRIKALADHVWDDVGVGGVEV